MSKYSCISMAILLSLTSQKAGKQRNHKLTTTMIVPAAPNDAARSSPVVTGHGNQCVMSIAPAGFEHAVTDGRLGLSRMPFISFQGVLPICRIRTTRIFPALPSADCHRLFETATSQAIYCSEMRDGRNLQRRDGRYRKAAAICSSLLEYHSAGASFYIDKAGRLQSEILALKEKR